MRVCPSACLFTITQPKMASLFHSKQHYFVFIQNALFSFYVASLGFRPKLHHNWKRCNFSPYVIVPPILPTLGRADTLLKTDHQTIMSLYNAQGTTSCCCCCGYLPVFRKTNQIFLSLAFRLKRFWSGGLNAKKFLTFFRHSDFLNRKKS